MSDVVSRLRRAAAAKVIEIELGGEKFHIRELGGAERVALFELQEKFVKNGEIFGDAGLAAFGLCDEKGRRLAPPDKMEELRAELLKEDEDGNQISAQVLAELSTRTLAISGLKITAVEEAGKKSTASQSSSSGTDSHSHSAEQ